ncbi:unnamed protein product [Orchesella dallaii]|uniref:C2H2-type domain-containing protein n=1 Tax=Orchesella dallaii TaxID=48710 RepID=A0ABP1QYP2_9HEXA
MKSENGVHHDSFLEPVREFFWNSQYAFIILLSKEKDVAHKLVSVSTAVYLSQLKSSVTVRRPAKPYAGKGPLDCGNISSTDLNYKHLEEFATDPPCPNDYQKNQDLLKMKGMTKHQQPELHPKYQGIWRCPSCPTGFSEPEKFILHEVTKHGVIQVRKNIRKYQCTRCPRIFRHTKSLINHFLTLHLKIDPKNPAKIQEKAENKGTSTELPRDENVKLHHIPAEETSNLYSEWPEESRSTSSSNLISSHSTPENLKENSVIIPNRTSTVTLADFENEVIPAYDGDVKPDDFDFEQSSRDVPIISNVFSLAGSIPISFMEPFGAPSAASSSKGSVIKTTNMPKQNQSTFTSPYELTGNLHHPSILPSTFSLSTSTCSRLSLLKAIILSPHSNEQNNQLNSKDLLNQPKVNHSNLVPKNGKPIPSAIFNCGICKTPFGSRLKLKNHMEFEHHQRTVFKCQLCLKKLLYFHNFKTHMGSQHGKVFPNNEELMREENVSISYLCANEIGNLNSGRKAGSVNSTRIPIQNATKGTTEQVDLNERDMPLKSYQCRVPGCARKFKYFSWLKVHQRKHDGVFPFHCGWEGCTWRFTCKWELTQHNKRHTKEKPLECRICPRTFSRNYQLVIHMRIHKLPMTGIGSNVHQN